MTDENLNSENPIKEEKLASEEATPENEQVQDHQKHNLGDDNENTVKLDKKTKMAFFCVFAVILCVVLLGGYFMLSNKQAESTTPSISAYPEGGNISTQIVVSSSVPDTSESLPSQPASLLPSSALETVLPSSTVPPASTSNNEVPGSSSLPSVSTSSPPTTIPSLNVNTENFSRLAKLLYAAGFLYDAKQNMFYSHNDPWQRNMGYTSLYDDLSVLGDMYFDTIRFQFKYGDKKWMYQIWKGRYGATSGCEIGVYCQDRRTDNPQFFDVPSDEDPLPGLYFELYRYEDFMFSNGPLRHWWLTGFRLLDSSESDALHMKCRFYMPSTEMCDAFETAVKEQCESHSNLIYTRENDVIYLDWAY